MPSTSPNNSYAPYISGTATSGTVRVSFRIQTNTTSAPDNVVPPGAVTAADQTGTGLYTMTLANYTKYAGLISGSVSVGLVATGAEGLAAHIVSYTASTGVLLVDVYSLGGAASDALADVKDDGWILVDLVMATNAADVVSTAI